MANNASSRRQFLVSITPASGPAITGYWARRTGGGLQSSTTKEYDGGALVPYVLTSPPQVEDVVVSRPFVPGRDDSLVTSLLPQVGRLQATLTQTATDPNYSVNGGKTTWTGILSKVTPPDVDADANDGARIELTFTCSAVA